MNRSPGRPHSRRRFLQLAASGGLGGLLLACGAGDDAAERVATAPTPGPTPTPTPPPPPTPAATPAPTPTATPTPHTLSRAHRYLDAHADCDSHTRPDAGADSRADAVAPPVARRSRCWRARSGRTRWSPTTAARRGPAVLVLGGVHGNEPGSWLATEENRRVAARARQPDRDPARQHRRDARRRADAARARRPQSALPRRTRRRAADVADGRADRRGRAPLPRLARPRSARVVGLLRGSAGRTAARRSSARRSPAAPARTARPLRASPRTSTRRWSSNAIGWSRETGGPGGSRLRRAARRSTDTSSWGGWRPGRGGSSLSLGNYVEGLTPILVEMGQHRQALERRAELHQLVTRVALTQRGML